MGFAPREVEDMSLYQFDACARGWRAAKGGGEGEGISDRDFDELSAMLDGATG